MMRTLADDTLLGEDVPGEAQAIGVPKKMPQVSARCDAARMRRCWRGCWRGRRIGNRGNEHAHRMV